MTYRINWEQLQYENAYLPDADFITATIDHNVTSPTSVDFILEAADGITWWKGIHLPDGQEIWTQDATTRGAASVPLSRVQAGSPDLEFKKAKLFGVHTGMYLLGSLAQHLLGGDRVTFTWRRDEAWTNNAGYEAAVIADIDENMSAAPTVQGWGYWLKPNHRYQCTVNVVNTSDVDWGLGDGYQFLSTQTGSGPLEPKNDFPWAPDPMDITGPVPTAAAWAAFGPVPPQYYATFTFTIQAPQTEGRYHLAYGMIQKGIGYISSHFDQIAVYSIQPTPVIPTPPPPLPPPMPPPPPPTSGEVVVSMGQNDDPQAPDSWYLYDGDAGDPSATWVSQGHAKIVAVKNTSQYSFSLTHDAANGKVGLPINFTPQEIVTYPFTSLEVQGQWEAEFSGKITEAPYTLTVWVQWKV